MNHEFGLVRMGLCMLGWEEGSEMLQCASRIGSQDEALNLVDFSQGLLYALAKSKRPQRDPGTSS